MMAVASQPAMITGFSRPAQVGGCRKCSAAVKLSSFGANLRSFMIQYRLNFIMKGGDKRTLSASNTRAAVGVQSTGQETGSRKNEEVLKVALICGGPSAERGISLNSARSVLDHIQAEDLSVSCYYIDCQLNAYAISPAQMYSNTPADFDFKLNSLAEGFKSLSEFMEHLAVSTDIVFPLIHGKFGEDGSIQELIEKAGIPFVGTGSREARLAFDKGRQHIESADEDIGSLMDVDIDTELRSPPPFRGKEKTPLDDRELEIVTSPREDPSRGEWWTSI